MWAKKFCHQLQSRSWQDVAEGLRDYTKSFPERMLLDLLLQLSRSTKQSANNFRILNALLKEIGDLKAKTKALMMVPQLQALAAALLAGSYSVLLPILFPQFFPSFLHLGLKWEFIAGEFILVFGLAITIFISLLPKRFEKSLVQPCFFFHILAYRLESGEDLDSAWRSALRSVDFPIKWMKVLRRSEIRTESFEDFLQRIGTNLSYPWTDLSIQMQWALRQSSQLAPYLRELAANETNRVSQLWELEARRLSVFVLLPLLLLCFPASIYLILGPQFILLWR